VRGPRLRLVAAFDTRGHVAAASGLDPAMVTRQLEHAAPRPLAAVLSGLERAGAPLLFVDCTASEALAARHAGLLARGIAVVTANKHGLAASLAHWRALRQSARRTPLRASTTVGAGLPVLSTVRALRRRGDALVSLRATLSGTLTHVLAAAHRGRPLSQAVAEAHALGLTEPNPAADLSGADVARKLLIVLREAGIALEPHDVHVEPLADAEALRARTVASLLARLAQDDEAFAARIAAVAAAGKRLVYAASWDGRHARAGLIEVDERDALALARAGENVVRLRTALHDGVPLVIAGPGAGVAVTAAGVHGDVLSAARALGIHDRYQRAAGRGVADLVRPGSGRHHPAWA
jgi:aspartokinase/homoserine dehydrogenase 1